MTIQIEFLLNKGYSIDRLSMLNRSNYSYWKACTHIFVQAHGYNLWKIIIDSSHTSNALIEHDKEIA